MPKDPLCERVVEHGKAREAAESAAQDIARFPQEALIADKRSIIEGWGLSVREGLKLEWANGVNAVLKEGAMELVDMAILVKSDEEIRKWEKTRIVMKI